ncbi:MAG: hypothetical protein RBG13Loki_0137 [Promethearchaeota archaeon CR_4]|nr:MAG: hypothetical protein RBG13Loki_0137 [Candidatus Lokiarchaeota archaeon CR_4]
MADTKSNYPIGRSSIGSWMLGGSVACYVAALITFIDFDLLGYLIFTIVGAVFLVLGIILLGLTLLKMGKDPALKAGRKPILALIVLSIIVIVVLAIIPNAL